MKIYSENIRNYIINNTNLEEEDEITINDINKIDYLIIKRLNNRMKIAEFVPAELSYFKNLKTCGFSDFTIRDDIKENLNSLEKLSYLKFDHCRFGGNDKINNEIEGIELNYSEFNLFCMCNNKMKLKDVILKNVEDVNTDEICKFENIQNISLLNCNIRNFKNILQLKNLKKVKIIGSKIDDKETVEILKTKINVTYSEEEYFPIG
jgi:hypothetical protein